MVFWPNNGQNCPGVFIAHIVTKLTYIIFNSWVRTRYATCNTVICTLAFKAIFTEDSGTPKASHESFEMQISHLKGCSPSGQNIFKLFKQDINTETGVKVLKGTITFHGFLQVLEIFVYISLGCVKLLKCVSYLIFTFQHMTHIC